VLERWLLTCPELDHVALDVAPGRPLGAARSPVPQLALRLCNPEEKLLLACLDGIAAGNQAAALEAALQGPSEGGQFPDLHLLAGALLLAEGRAEEALAPLQKAYLIAMAPESERGNAEPLGHPARRLYPFLRILLRIAPSQLLPLYVDGYCAALLYAVALGHTGSTGEALEVLRDCVKEFGMQDELRVIGGQLHLARGDLDMAATALAEPPQTQHDALDLTRTVFLALVEMQRGQLRSAVRQLRPAVLHPGSANPQTQARARLVLAQAYAQAGLPLEALRHSGVVPAEQLPQFVADWVAQQEAQWVREAGELRELEVERMARADAVTLHIPETDDVLKLESRKLEIARNPLDELKPTEMSWARRREQEQQIGEIKAAVARGEQVTLGEPVYSTEARKFLAGVKRMQQWWPERQQALRLAGPDSLARDPRATAHVRFDFRGTRSAPLYSLPCERRLALLAWAGGASAVILVVLLFLRACTQGV
jgi:tetratricopeptide (TPR) repeat protein